jgi:AraC family transcriptional regulator
VDGHLGEKLAISNLGTTRSREWMHRVVTLLEAAVGQLHDQEHPAQGTLLEAASLMRQQIDPPVTREVPDGRGRLLAWQVRKVRDYIDSHITGPVPVADLCALVQRSEAHFSRSFKCSFGESPHSFVVRRRVELAAQHMLTTDASLSDIALGCGFTDQAHLCKHFRQAVGQTPAAWRRAYRSHHEEDGAGLLTPITPYSPSMASGKGRFRAPLAGAPNTCDMRRPVGNISGNKIN